MNEEDINQRVILLIDKLGLSKAEFAREIDVSLPLMTHITTGRNRPGLEVVQRILNRYEEVNPDWLLLNNGKMYREKPEKPDLSGIREQTLSIVSAAEQVNNWLNTVIQYHKLLDQEIRHLSELDNLLYESRKSISEISENVNKLKVEMELQLSV